MPVNEREIFWDWSDPAQRVNLARYVQENLDDIEKIVKEAEDELKQIPPWHDPSFDGYSSGNPNRVRAQVKALFQRLQKGKPKAGKYLTYRVEPPDSPKGRQRLRLAREVLQNGHSECMGWALLLSACLLNVRLNPLIIITKNKQTGEVHAMPGYWLAEQCFSQVVVGDKDVEACLGQKIEVVNATRIAVDENGRKRSFEQAKKEAHEELLPPKNPQWEIVFAVELRKAREEGINGLLPLEPWHKNHALPGAEHFQWRPELKDIHEWWQDESSYGVLALVGIGGTGKTALVHRFLAQLPNSDVKEEGVSTDETLRIPDALFVWSFYEHPDVDRCATALYNYLAEQQLNKATFEQVQDVLSRNWRGCRVLLVFDGVETLQVAPGIEPEEEGGAFGQFLPEGAPLARFLRWCCDGPRPVHVLATSRFGLTDLRRYKSAGGYLAIELRDLPLESARALLRATGVKSLDWQLNELIRKFGSHALTLELLGNYIFLVHRGNPTPVLTRDIPPLESKEVRVQTETRDTATLSMKLADVLRFYEELLQQDDPAALGVLQRLCLFHIIPVDEHLLAEIFSGAEESIAGPLAGLGPQQIRRHLLNLCGKYRLVHGEPQENPRRFSVHPLVRGYFYSKTDYKVALHEAVRAHLDALAGSPMFSHSTDVLDALEELVYHTLQVGQRWTALRLYWTRLGGYSHLGQTMGAYARGEAMLRMIIPFEELFSNQADTPTRIGVLHDMGNYLKILGALKKAAWCFQQQACISVANADNLATTVAYQDLTYVLLSQGRLQNAWIAASEAMKSAQGALNRQELSHAYADRAWVHALQGEINKAWIDFRAATLYRGIAEVRGRACGVLTPDGRLVTQSHYIPVYLSGTHGTMQLRCYEPSHKAEYRVVVEIEQFIPEHNLAVLRVKHVTDRDLIKGPEEQFSLLIMNDTRMIHEIKVLPGILDGIPGIWYSYFLLHLNDLTAAEQVIIFNKLGSQGRWAHTTALCNILLGMLSCMKGEPNEAQKALIQARDWGTRTADQEVLVWGNLIRARLALDTGDLSEAEQAIREGLRIAEYCSYGLYWIDLQVAKGQWELACGRQMQEGKELPPELENWTPQQWFERAEMSVLRALNGQVKDSDEPASLPDLSEDKLAMLGARHPECGYAWGEGDALHLLGEALLALAQCVGCKGYDAKGRSYAELLKEARQAAEKALTLRRRIQDPKARETENLLARLRREYEAG